MLCLCGALLNPYVAPVALPKPHRQRPSHAAGSFSDPIADVAPSDDNRQMLARYLSFALLLTGCGPSVPEGLVQRIEIRESGWESLHLSIARSGSGSFERYGGPAPESITEAFHITPQGFRNVAARLAEFRRKSVPRTDASIQEMGNRPCPEGVPYVTDNGAIYVRWVDEGFDQHYLADLGCDRERYAERNAKLREVVRSFPLQGR